MSNRKSEGIDIEDPYLIAYPSSMSSPPNPKILLEEQERRRASSADIEGKPLYPPIKYKSDETQPLVTKSINDDDHRENLHWWQRGTICGVYIPKRYILVFIGWLGFLNVYALRVILSIAIVPMKDHYKWSNTEKGYILSSFFVGYIVTQVPGGWLASRYGGKWVFGFGIFFTGVFTLFTPLAASLNLWLVVVVRALEGLTEGVSYPAMHAVFCKWAPPNERSSMASWTYSGAFAGTIIAFPASGALDSSGFLGGWPSIFYVFGGVALFWIVLWIFFMTNSPAEHSTISPEEREYIMSNLPPEKKLDVPWLKILTSIPFWALLINHTASNWGFYTLLTWLPTYFKDILDFDMENAGVVIIIPYATLVVSFMFAGSSADILIKSKLLSVTTVRKLYQSVGLTIASGGLVACGFVTDVPLSVFLMSVSLFGTGLLSAGYGVNHLDISPQYAGVLMGFTNTAATIPGIISPTLTGFIVPDHDKDAADWRIVFYITAAIYMFGMVVFVFFAKGEPSI